MRLTFISIFALAFLFISCSGVTNNESEHLTQQEVKTEDIVHNGTKYSLTTENEHFKRYSSKDGKFLLIVPSKEGEKTAIKGKSISASWISTFSYTEKNTTKYSSGNTVGYFEEYSEDFTNEIFRARIDFNGLKDKVPAGSTINSLGLKVYRVNPSGQDSTISQRGGVVEFSAFPTSTPPYPGTVEFFNLVETSNSYFSATNNLNNLNNDSISKTLTSGQFFNDLKGVLSSNSDLFSVALKSQKETSSGAVFDISGADLLIEYTDPATPPSTPSLSSPENNTLIRSTTNFSWNAPSGTAPFTYQIQIDDNSNFSSPEVNETAVSTSSYDASNLTTNKKHYWRVRASNSAGTSNWSSVRSIRVRLDAPIVSRSVTSGHPRLDWSPIPNASSYTVLYKYPGAEEWEVFDNITNNYHISYVAYAPTMQVGAHFNFQDTFTYRVIAISSIGYNSINWQDLYFKRDSEDCTRPGCAE